MKSISRFGKAIVLFVTILFSVIVMNVISVMMMIKLSKKREDDQMNEGYFFAGFECSAIN